MLTKGFDHLGRPLPLSLSADEQGIGDRKRRPRMRLRIARPMPAIGKIGRSLYERAISLTRSMNSSSAGVAASRARGLVSRCLILTRAVISSRVLEVSILVATATAIGVTILLVGNPLALFAEVKSAPQPGADQSTPIILTSAIQSPADPEALSPTHEIAAASVRAGQTQTEKSEPSSSEALFRQFQAWAAEQDAPKLGRDAQKHRSAARAEIQNTQEPRARIQQQNARVQARPVQDARAERDDPAPSFLQSLNPFACAFEKKCSDHVF